MRNFVGVELSFMKLGSILVSFGELYFVRFAACATGKCSFLHYITAICSPEIRTK